VKFSYTYLTFSFDTFKGVTEISYNQISNEKKISVAQNPVQEYVYEIVSFEKMFTVA